MGRIDWYLIGGILISALLLHLSTWGLWLTHNLLYLFSMACCLCTLLFSTYQLIKHILQSKDSPAQICVVIMCSSDEPDPYHDPLYVKVKNRM
jgi:predicted PurR-regulated permease PerM